MNAAIISDLHDDEKYIMQKIRRLRDEIGVDAVFLLGDIKSTDLDIIQYQFNPTLDNPNPDVKKPVPIFGITGDFDTPNMYEKYPNIKNIDGQVIDFMGYKIGGFSGSKAYKHGFYSVRTEDEAEMILSEMGPCDIFLSHETGFNYMQTILDRIDIENEKKIAMVEEQKKLQDVKSKFKAFMDKILKNKDDSIVEKIDNSAIRTDNMYGGFKAIDEYIMKYQPKVHFFGHYHINFIEVPTDAKIETKTGTYEGKPITYKKVVVQSHKELAAFDKGATTCACNYLFGFLTIGDNFDYKPISVREEHDDLLKFEEERDKQLIEESYAINLPPKERKKFLEERAAERARKEEEMMNRREVY